MDDIIDLLYAPDEAPIDDLLFAPGEADNFSRFRKFKKGEQILVGPENKPMHLYRKKIGRSPNPPPLHVQASRAGKKAFDRFSMIERQHLVTKEPKYRCRLHVNALLAILLSELELGHDVLLPGIGRFMFEKIKKRKYKCWDGNVYVKPEHSRLIFSASRRIDLALRRNTRVIDPNDPQNPQEQKVHLYRNTQIRLKY